MNIKISKLTPMIIAACLTAMIAATACGGGDPEELDVPVRIDDGVMDPGTIKVKQGDMVTLKIEANEGGEFHLHTYDIEMDIEAKTETDFYFVADATGRFKITYHPVEEAEHNEEEHDEDDSHGGIFESEEIAPGGTFAFTVDEHQAGETIPYHSHLRPALNGTIIVSEAAGETDAVAIEYSDDGAEPHEVNVGPGTVITWTNNSSVPQTVISGLHADMETEEHQDEEEEHDEGEEIEIGFLEVQPR